MRKVHIRWMIRRDLPEIVVIENRSFACGWSWSERDFIEQLRRNCIGMVAESNDQIRAYVIYELHRSRIELLNLAVCPNYRNIGIGRSLIDKLKSKLSGNRRQEITLKVTDRSTESHLFLSACGFRATAVCRRYYFNDSDAYCFQFRHKAGGSA